MNRLRAFLLRRLLNPAQRTIVEALDRPDRFIGDTSLTNDDAKNWGAMLAGPLGVKIDHCMINWLQQEAQRALFAPTAEIARTVGYAAGCRAGWEMAKTLSRIGATESAATEDTSPTADAGLAHHQP
jgi:hypothetical protein